MKLLLLIENTLTFYFQSITFTLCCKNSTNLFNGWSFLEIELLKMNIITFISSFLFFAALAFFFCSLYFSTQFYKPSVCIKMQVWVGCLFELTWSYLTSSTYINFCCGAPCLWCTMQPELDWRWWERWILITVEAFRNISYCYRTD